MGERHQMTDAILINSHRKAELSFAYLSALSAMAGYTCQRGPDPDVDTIDATVRAGGTRRPVLDVQLKATSSPVWGNDGLHFRLSRKNYDDLREDRTARIILLVLELPEDERDWLECGAEQLILRRCAWWEWLFDFPEIEGDSRTVVIPGNQRFDLAAMQGLISRIRQGQPLKEGVP